MQRSQVQDRPDESGVSSFDLLGKRWSALIIQDLESGPRRFREILTKLGRINDKVLSQRLKELEEADIIRRQVFPEVPIRVEYSLTDKGRALLSIVGEMERWDSAWTAAPVRPHRLTVVPNEEAPAPLAAVVPFTPALASPPAPQAAVPEPPADPATPPASSGQGRPQGVRGFWKRFGL